VIAFIFGGIAHADQSRYGGTLIFGSMGEPLSLDPGVILDSESSQVANAIFEPLIRYDSVRDKYIPLLASGWDVSSDQKTYTFFLRKNVKFHDGTLFNSGAVKFSWERQMLVNHPFHDTSYGSFTYYRSMWGGYPGNIREIKIIDNNTVQVRLYSRSYRFLKDISSIQFAIVSPRAVYEHKDSFYQNPVGTGPFKFVEWRKWQRIVLESNKEYWSGRPYIDRLVFEPVPGEKSRRRHMERGRFDVMENPSTDFVYNITVKKKYPDLKIAVMPGTNFSFLAVNCQKSPFNNSDVRVALNYAIDRKRILRDINENMPLASSPFENLWGMNIEGKAYTLDHDMARRLFAKAGYSRGFEVDLWYPKISRPYLTDPERVAKGIAQSLREVGLKVILKGVKWEVYTEKLRQGEYELALTGFVGINYDPDIYFEMNWDRNNAIIGGTNISFFRSDRIHSLLTASRFESDAGRRARNYETVQKIISDESPIIPLYYNTTSVILNKKVNSFYADKNGLVDFSQIWINR
jgi:peptide/nickel transport system substrate-binding protein